MNTDLREGSVPLRPGLTISKTQILVRDFAQATSQENAVWVSMTNTDSEATIKAIEEDEDGKSAKREASEDPTALPYTT